MPKTNQPVDKHMIKEAFDQQIKKDQPDGYVNFYKNVATYYNSMLGYLDQGMEPIGHGVAIRACREAGCSIEKVNKKKSEKKKKSPPVYEFILYLARNEYRRLTFEAQLSDSWTIEDISKWESINTVREVLGLPRLQPINHPPKDYFE